MLLQLQDTVASIRYFLLKNLIEFPCKRISWGENLIKLFLE
uniref:Uncharacterized protein n=1 Tax=Arundo donax TaxID=35708 RepID=A0A0A9FG22_ARUDO